MNARIRTLAQVFSLAMLLLLALASSGAALEVRETGSTGSSGGNDLNISFEPAKDVYRVDESIRFKFKANKPCYLYIFSLNDDEGKGYLLLPNKKQQDNKFEANMFHTIPDKNIEFYSSKPGVEKIALVASTKKLDIDMKSYSTKGDFFAASSDVVSKDLKALRVRDAESKDQKIVKEISVVVAGQSGSSSRSSESWGSGGSSGSGASGQSGKVTSFVTTDKKEYRIGDTMTLSFGADKDGTMYLYVIEPDGTKKLLTAQEVTANTFKKLHAEVTRPMGEHTLLAVFDKTGGGKDIQAKGLQLINDENSGAARYTFKVKK